MADTPKKISESEIFDEGGNDWCKCPKCGEKIAIVRKIRKKETGLEKILVIDDEVGLLDLFENALGDQYEVFRALTADEGLKVFTKENPKLLILDIRLPDRNGLDVLCDIREKNKDVPVVMITAYTDERASVKCMKLGASAYLTKPLDMDYVKLIIKNLMTA